MNQLKEAAVEERRVYCGGGKKMFGSDCCNCAPTVGECRYKEGLSGFACGGGAQGSM